MVGILSGAYSSIFIAAPLLTIFKEREPEYRRRIGVDVIEKGIGGRMAVPAAAAAAAAEPTEVDGDVDGLEEPEPAVAGAPVAPGDGAASRSQQKRERRRQRRSTRPHGRR
jgi:hypothetical protein